MLATVKSVFTGLLLLGFLNAETQESDLDVLNVNGTEYLHPRFAPNTNQMLRFISRWQNPTNCLSAKFLVWEWRLQSNGIGSDLHVMSVALAIAMKTGRLLTLHPGENYPWLPWALDRSRCPTLNMDCFFEPLTHCTILESDMTSAQLINPSLNGKRKVCSSSRVSHHSLLTCFLIPPSQVRILELGANGELYGKYRKLIPKVLKSPYGGPSLRPAKFLTLGMYRAIAATYFLRYNPRFKAELAEGVKRATPAGGMPSCITVHVRHGDKGTEMALHPLSDYMDAVERMRKEYPAVSGINTIMLSTEDEHVIEETRQYAAYRFIFTEHPRHNEFSPMEQAKRIGYNETLNSFINLELSMLCQGFVLTTGSNWSRLLDELRLTRGKWNTPVLDIEPGQWKR